MSYGEFNFTCYIDCLWRLVRLQQVSVRLNLIIQDSLAIQYAIELEANGFVDCVDSTLTTATKIRMLEEQQAAWRCCEWKVQRVAQIRPGCCAFDFRNGVAAFGRCGESGSESVPTDVGPLPSEYTTEITVLQLASATTSNDEEEIPEWTLELGIVIRAFAIDPLIDLLVLVEQTAGW